VASGEEVIGQMMDFRY